MTESRTTEPTNDGEHKLVKGRECGGRGDPAELSMRDPAESTNEECKNRAKKQCRTTSTIKINHSTVAPEGGGAPLTSGVWQSLVHEGLVGQSSVHEGLVGQSLVHEGPRGWLVTVFAEGMGLVFRTLVSLPFSWSLFTVLFTFLHSSALFGTPPAPVRTFPHSSALFRTFPHSSAP